MRSAWFQAAVCAADLDAKERGNEHFDEVLRSVIAVSKANSGQILMCQV